MGEKNAARGSGPYVDRRAFLRTIGLGSAATLLAESHAFAAPAAGGADDRPNILLIESDDHHPDALGAVNPVVQTPNLDKLAANGVLFTNHVCQGTACAPSRTSLLTGAYPHNNGVYTNWCKAIDERHWTLPRALQRSGYTTSLQGKNHFKLGPDYKGKDCNDPHLLSGWKAFGFDHVHAVGGKVAAGRAWKEGPYRDYLREKGALSTLENYFQKTRSGSDGRRIRPWEKLQPLQLDVADYHDSYIGRTTTEWLRSYRRDEPFFAWVQFVAPHSPMDVPEPYFSMHDPADVPLPVGGVDPGDPWTEEQIRRVRASYYGMVSLMDHWVGQMVEALARTERLANTVIIFCGDQGSMLGDHHSWGKSTFYRGGINSPLVVHWPKKFRQGVVIDQPVEMLDLSPTILELAGAGRKEMRRSHGATLIPLLTGNGIYGRDAAFAEQRWEKMIVTDRYKYIYDARKPDKPILYDLQADPKELRNIAGQRPDVERELHARLLEWLAGTYRHANSAPPTRGR